jgi:hypothetical protein
LAQPIKHQRPKATECAGLNREFATLAASPPRSRPGRVDGGVAPLRRLARLHAVARCCPLSARPVRPLICAPRTTAPPLPGSCRPPAGRCPALTAPGPGTSAPLSCQPAMGCCPLGATEQSRAGEQEQPKCPLGAAEKSRAAATLCRAEQSRAAATLHPWLVLS